jgi:hypothetical protein
VPTGEDIRATRSRKQDSNLKGTQAYMLCYKRVGSAHPASASNRWVFLFLLLYLVFCFVLLFSCLFYYFLVSFIFLFSPSCFFY